MARSSPYPPSVDPGFPSLPETPEGWLQTTYGEVLEVVERPISLKEDNTYRLVNAKRNRGGITLRGTLPGREILTKTQFEVKAGDFLISRRQIIHGACGVVPLELDGAIVSNEYSTLNPRKGLLLDFLRHYSNTPYFQRTCFHSSHGVDVEKMIFKIGEWLIRRVDIPPIDEQRKIAAILTAVDDAIEATQALTNQLHVVKKAMMAELLTRGLPGRHKEFKETELGEVPNEWTVARLRTIAALGSGGTPARDRAEYWNGEIPWVKTGEINYGVITDTEETITEAGLKSSAAKLLPRGTLLMAMYGQGATRGRVALLGVEATVNQACLSIQPRGDITTSRFLFHVFSSRYDELRSLGHEGTQRNLNAKLVGDVLLRIPARQEQDEIVKLLDGASLHHEAEVAYRLGLTQLKAALLSVLLTGEIRVPLNEASA